MPWNWRFNAKKKGVETAKMVQTTTARGSQDEVVQGERGEGFENISETASHFLTRRSRSNPVSLKETDSWQACYVENVICQARDPFARRSSEDNNVTARRTASFKQSYTLTSEDRPRTLDVLGVNDKVTDFQASSLFSVSEPTVTWVGLRVTENFTQLPRNLHCYVSTYLLTHWIVLDSDRYRYHPIGNSHCYSDDACNGRRQ
eukprot:3229408-Pyramimonas_sp.AAC.1